MIAIRNVKGRYEVVDNATNEVFGTDLSYGEASRIYDDLTEPREKACPTPKE